MNRVERSVVIEVYETIIRELSNWLPSAMRRAIKLTYSQSPVDAERNRNPQLATAFVVFILTISPAFGFLVAQIFDGFTGLGEPRSYLPGEIDRILLMHDFLYRSVRDLTSLALTLFAARQFGGSVSKSLSLHAPRHGSLSYAFAILLSACAIVVWFSVVLLWKPEFVAQDLHPYRELMQREASWLMPPLLCLLAPVTEELLFRGFLFSALRKTSLGLLGAAVATSLFWTTLHVDRTFLAQLQIFGSGILLCFLLAQSGSVRVPIVCHALFNIVVSFIVIVLEWPPI